MDEKLVSLKLFRQFRDDDKAVEEFERNRMLRLMDTLEELSAHFDSIGEDPTSRFLDAMHKAIDEFIGDRVKRDPKYRDSKFDSIKAPFVDYE